MAENIGDEQVNGFSRHLEELQERLSPAEAAMLSGIFSVAADAIRPSGDGLGKTARVSAGGEIPSAEVRDHDPDLSIADQFRQQFLGAFTADPPDPPAAQSLIIIPGSPGTTIIP